MSDQVIRVLAFTATGLGLAVWEVLTPRRVPAPGRTGRWIGNLGVVILSGILIRLIFPILPVGLAMLARQRHWGLMPWLHWPEWLEVALGFFLLDLGIYAQHRAFHAWRPLWRLHRMHHADTFLDFTSGVRFHPLEFLSSMAFKLCLVLALAPPALAVLLFELGLNCLVMFNHANIRLPGRVDCLLRLLVVTPDMHRVHHSTDMREANRNFGFNFPWWDRLFGTYQSAPRLGHLDMVIGLNIFRDRKFRSLGRMLVMPFI